MDSAKSGIETVESLLLQLATLTATGGERSWSLTLESLLDEVRAAHNSEVQYRRLLRRILQLYTGGMGGFGDVVLQANGQALPEQREFDALRHCLFEAARDQV